MARQVRLSRGMHDGETEVFFRLHFLRPRTRGSECFVGVKRGDGKLVDSKYFQEFSRAEQLL